MGLINMEIVDNFDYIISEKGNNYIALRKVKWSETSEPKLDLRKYSTDSSGNEVIRKGVCFDDETADELTRVLIDTGYGNTREIIDTLRKREDFEQCYEDSINNVSPDSSDNEEYFDIRGMLAG